MYKSVVYSELNPNISNKKYAFFWQYGCILLVLLREKSFEIKRTVKKDGSGQWRQAGKVLKVIIHLIQALER